MNPYLDKQGFRNRSVMADGEILLVENDSPGFLATRIAMRSSYINGRLRKRYGNAGSPLGNSLPFGQTAPALIAQGTNPPNVTLTGRPILGCMQFQIIITTGGALGSAAFKWSSDNGVTFTSGVLTAATVTLGSTGVIANFSTGTYSTDNSYASDTCVPEIVLSWLTVLVTDDMYRKRGRDPQDPAMADLKEDVVTALAEIKEAADGDTGLFDLPSSEDTDSAVTTGGPLGYSEASPYVWTDIEARRGREEDYNGGGTL